MDTVDAKTRSRIMSRVRSKNTSPEIKVRSRLHRAGFRFRIHRRDLPGNPDLVLPKYRYAVFVHGCFWHQHSCKDFRWPKSNVEFWRRKIERNVERDRRSQQELQSIGWRVHTIWACDLEGGTLDLMAKLELPVGPGRDKGEEPNVDHSKPQKTGRSNRGA